MSEPRPLIPVVPLALILPGPVFHPQQRASDADRDTAVDILCAAVAEGRLTLAELDERAGAALCARTICELAALIADLPGPLPGPLPSGRFSVAHSDAQARDRTWRLRPRPESDHLRVPSATCVMITNRP